MKKILSVVMLAMLTSVTLTNCTSSKKKVEDAKENVQNANQKLDEANVAYLVDVENYKIETNQKILANEQSIKDFKLRISKDKKEARDEYEKKIAALELKNTDNKKKLDDYKADGKDKWESFKTEFNHDKEELGKSLSDLTVKNTK